MIKIKINRNGNNKNNNLNQSVDKAMWHKTSLDKQTLNQEKENI